MNIKFDENWLNWAVEIEDDAACDISAGMDYGQNLSKYLEIVINDREPISHEKFLQILRDEAGSILSEEEIERLADDFQFRLHKAIISKSIAA
jgi:hypothetical protein